MRPFWLAEEAPKKVRRAFTRTPDPWEVPGWYAIDRDAVPKAVEQKTIAVYVSRLLKGRRVYFGVFEKEMGRDWWFAWASTHSRKEGGLLGA